MCILCNPHWGFYFSGSLISTAYRIHLSNTDKSCDNSYATSNTFLNTTIRECLGHIWGYHAARHCNRMKKQHIKPCLTNAGWSFSLQGEGEGDPLQGYRSASQRPVRAVGHGHQHHGYQPGQREGSLHDGYDTETKQTLTTYSTNTNVGLA